ncbi:AAA family ATPase [Tardiphaga sp.]|uniref:nucleotide-binding protein n=1 Tax=Tardiphaga sp. TaxID=1926292 RepID=UPI0025E9F7C3|nr:AAA family ATPase [Tardiphaga sp.]
MRTITFTSQKGGVGKTSLAASLAVAAAQAGETVIALDLDPQGSLGAWGDERQAETPAVDRLGPDQIAQLPSILTALAAKGFTLCILDTPGIANTAANLAVNAADLCLIPARPSRIDIVATWPTVEAVKRIGRPLAFVINQAPPGRNTRASEAAAGLGLLGLLAEPIITARADHQDALAGGTGVTEYNPTGKAAEEVQALWAWVDQRTKGKMSNVA